MENKTSFLLLSLFTSFFISTVQAIECKTSIENKCIQISVSDTKGKAVQDMVVYLEPLDGQILEKTNSVVTVLQNNKAFSPYITVSQTQKSVSFVNQDDITHHIYSADNDNNFSFKIRSGEEHLTDHFNKEAAIAMGCNIHDWMSGYLLIVDTPYFGKTDANGEVTFSLNQLGKYKVVLWHPQLPTDDHRQFKVKTVSENTALSFTLTKDLEQIPTQENSDDFDFKSDY